MNVRAIVAGPAAFVLGLLVASVPTRKEVAIPLGGARGPLLLSGLDESEAALSLTDAEVADERRTFYFRRVVDARTELVVPLVARGSFAMDVRMDSTVRTLVRMTGAGVSSEQFVTVGPWKRTRIAGRLAPGPLRFDVAFEDAPLVARSDQLTFRRYIDQLVVHADEGFNLPRAVRMSAGLLLSAITVIAFTAFGTTGAVTAALAGGLLVLAGVLQEPVGTALALPRLLLFAAGLVAMFALMARALSISRVSNARITLLGLVLLLGCGLLSFLPNHSPADLDIHIWRTVDLAAVPANYEGWLRYGSHYPTPSQARGSATEALGAGPPIPYSPLPYVVFYAAHVLGLDLHWSINAIEALCLALLLPLLFAVGSAAADEWGGLLAAILFTFDLAAIHHLGRAHAPAVVGGALGIAAFLLFGRSLEKLDLPGAVRWPAVFLGVGALGYSSTAVFYALAGLSLMALLTLDRGTRRLARPVAIVLVSGGLLAIASFYGHYLPGLVVARESSNAAFADPFPGRTFFIFHNESRQSLRLWRLGFYIPLLATIPAAFFVAKRCAGAARAFVLSWLGAWTLMMVLKEPFGFPLLLRWAKEDLYVAPALALVIGVAIAKIETRVARRTVAALAVAVAILLRARDYGFHANTLWFLQ